MKNLHLLLPVFIALVMNLQGQDLFTSTQLTFDPAQQGFPSWSPDGKYIVYSYSSREDTLGKNGLWRISPGEKEAVQVFSGIAEHPKWSPDGRYIVFDADTGNSIRMIPAEGGPQIDILPDSIQIVHGGVPCWSPDGKQIAFVEGGTFSLCVSDIQTGKVSRIYHEEGKIPLPGCWSPDGKHIFVALREKGSYQSTMLKISAAGSEKKEVPGIREGFYRYIAISPDGLWLVYAAAKERNLGLYIMPATGGKSIEIVAPEGFNESPCWSPDGTKIAFTSTRSGTFDIWLMDVDIEELRKEF